MMETPRQLGMEELRMSESGVTLPAFGGVESTLLWLVFASGACALGYGWWLIGRVLRHSAGPASMQAVAAAIQEGAEAYLGRQFRTMLLFIAAITIALFCTGRSTRTRRSPGGSPWRSSAGAWRVTGPAMSA
jgi:K(+)-stimulated pyrophosphate-energized sodium pump